MVEEGDEMFPLGRLVFLLFFSIYIYREGGEGRENGRAFSQLLLGYRPILPKRPKGLKKKSG